MMVTTEESFSDEDEEKNALSSSKSGFNIAVGLFDREGFTLEENYEQYGRMSIWMRQKSDKNEYRSNTLLETHPCTSEEIGVPEGLEESTESDEGSTIFFPFEGPSKIESLLNTSRSSLTCINEQQKIANKIDGEDYYGEIKIFGDRLDGGPYSQVIVRFRTCIEFD